MFSAGCTYVDGKNDREAAVVVDTLHSLLATSPDLTLGIVTLNLPQRKRILDEIDRRRSADADFARLYDAAESHDAPDDRPFVKNLENVQGDERDVIVFSLGYASSRVPVLHGSRSTRTPRRRFRSAFRSRVLRC